MNNVPMPDFELKYEGKNITENIKPFLVDLTYTDYLSDQSDELQVVFEDIDKKWINTWFPTQGDKLSLALGYVSEPLTQLGSFEIVEIEWNYVNERGSTVAIKALSAGISKANRTFQPRAWENTTLADIVRSIAKRLDLNIAGTIEQVKIKRVTQYQERDVEFLTRLAHEYGYSFKIVGKTLVFTTLSSLKQRDVVSEIRLDETLSIRLRDNIKDTAKKIEVVGYNAKQKKKIKAEKNIKQKRKSQNKADDNKNNASKNSSTQKQVVKNQNKTSKTTTAKAPKHSDTLKVVTRADNAEQISARATALQHQQQDEQQAGDVRLIGNPKLVAGNTIILKDMGVFSGKYLIKSARHNLRRGQGFTTDIEIRMIDHIATEQEQQHENP